METICPCINDLFRYPILEITAKLIDGQCMVVLVKLLLGSNYVASRNRHGEVRSFLTRGCNRSRRILRYDLTVKY